jgi:hypothetical protein
MSIKWFLNNTTIFKSCCDKTNEDTRSCSFLLELKQEQKVQSERKMIGNKKGTTLSIIAIFKKSQSK